MQRLLNFIGVENLETWNSMTLEQRRAGHEKVARHFEAYILQGKAPSFELQGVFNQLRTFMKTVYKTIKELANAGQIDIKLSHEVEQVFGRMLATDEAIREKTVADSYQALFETQEESGLSDEEWQTYQRTARERVDEARNELSSRSIADMQWLTRARSKELRKQQAANREKRKAMRAQVEREVSNEPIYRVREALSQPDYKLSREEWKEAMVRIPAPRGMTEFGGVSADSVMINTNVEADFQDAQHMMASLKTAPAKKARVDAITDARMMETYGDINSAEALDAAVNEAVYSQAHTRFVHRELAALTKGGTGNMLHRAAKMLAEDTVSKKKYKNLKPHLHGLAEKRAARNAQSALVKGDRDSAIEHKRAQVLQNHFFRAANKAKKDVDSAVKWMRKRLRPAARKGIARDYLDQMDALMEQVGLQEVSVKQAEKRQEFAEWHAKKMAENVPIVVPANYKEMLKKNYKNMTVEEILGLKAALENLAHLGKLKQTIIVGREQRNMDATLDKAGADALANNPQPHWLRSSSLQNNWTETSRRVRGGICCSGL
jgi:hypothetical protein